MASAYSQDLRVRALKLMESGMSLSQVSQMLKISRPTLLLQKSNPSMSLNVHQAAEAVFRYL